jgi:hypothetical protein
VNVFHRSNLALAIFDIVDPQGNRAAEVWAFKHPELIEIAMEDRAPQTFDMRHRLPWGRLEMSGYDPKGIHVANADDLADAVRRHWWNVDNPNVDPAVIGIGRMIERG